MAKLKVKDFVETYDIKESTVKSYVHRKKLHKDAKGFIDTENPVNKLLISELKLKIATNKVGSAGPKKKASEKPETKNKTGLSEIQKVYADIDLRKKLADADLQERSAELKKIQLEKLAGNMLPTDFVERTFNINIQSIFKNFDSSLENLAMIYVEETGGDRSDVSRLTNRLRGELSIIIDKAKKDANHEIKEEIKSIIDSRTQGQKK